MELDLNLKEEYKETELGLLPKDWEVVRLGDVITPDRSKIRREDYKGDISIVQKISFDTGQIDFRNKRTTRTDLYVADRDHLLISKINFHQGAVAITNTLTAATTHYEFYKVSDKADIFYLWRYFRTDEFKNIFYQEIKFRGFKKEANFKFIKNFKIPLPPLSEQKKIAYVLSTVQEAKEKTENVIKAMKELKKSMMKHLFTYGPVNLEEAERVTLKETEIDLIPEEWEMNTFGNLGTFQYGYTESANEREVGPKFLRITDINLDTNIINWASVPYCKIEEDRFANYSLNEGDILIARIGATTGKTCIIKNPPKSVFASYLIRFIVNRDIIDPNFLFYYTQDYRYWRQINAGKEGKLKKGVSSSQLKKFLLPVPSLLTQKKIASILTAIDQKIEAEENKKKTLEDLFKSLLHNLMTAKIRVNNLEKILD